MVSDLTSHFPLIFPPPPSFSVLGCSYYEATIGASSFSPLNKISLISNQRDGIGDKVIERHTHCSYPLQNTARPLLYRSWMISLGFPKKYLT